MPIQQFFNAMMMRSTLY